MRKSILCLLLAFVLVGPFQSSKKASRLPLQKSNVVLESPKNYAPRSLVSKSGEIVHYDPRPRVELLDERSGTYALKWIGYDGKEKTVIYHRPDAIDVVVSAFAAETGQVAAYTYTYDVHNLTSSGQDLSAFAVENFSSSVRTHRIGDGYVGEMSRNLPGLSSGNWVYFGLASVKPRITPGKTVRVKLESSAPPGLVQCRVTGGPIGMRGVGEEMPSELEEVLPAYEAWPKGHTIGPVDRLSNFTINRRLRYIRSRLPHFRELGWIIPDTVPWYEQNLRVDTVETVRVRAEQDLKAQRITTELFAMISAIRGRQ